MESLWCASVYHSFKGEWKANVEVGRQQLGFARTRSDALVKAKTPEEFEKHKEERAIRKSEHCLPLSFINDC